MIAFFRWAMSVIIMVGVILFTFANRENVAIKFSPLHAPIETYSFALALGALSLGFVMGGVMVWLNSTKIRIERRKQRKEITRLEKEIEALQNITDAHDPAHLIEHLK